MPLSRISSTVIPSTLLEVPVKYFSITLSESPTASKIWAPQYDWKVEIPIFEKTFSIPLHIEFI